MPATGTTRPRRATKVTGGSNPRPGSSKTQQTNMTKDVRTCAEQRVVILERENMMLRKNLNIVEIKKEFQKSALEEGDMNSLFYESLHDLEQKLQQYESNAEGYVGKIREEERFELIEQTKKITLLEEELLYLKRKLEERDQEIKMMAEYNNNVILRKDETIQKLLKENVPSVDHTHNISTETKWLTDKLANTENELHHAKEMIDMLKNRKEAGNAIKENTEEITRLKTDLREIKRYCKDAFEKLDQKDKMISQLQERLEVPVEERNPTPTTRYGAVSKTDTLQFLSR